VFHIPTSKSSFYSILLKIDQDAAEEMQAKGCLYCGGCLDRADYLRKPRGISEDPAPGFSLRYSLCCRSEGCRRRALPQSVRFLGRRVYLMFFILLCSSASESLVSRLARATSVSRQTLLRWRHYWLSVFPKTPVWKRTQGRFSPPPGSHELPVGLITRLGCDPSDVSTMLPVFRILAFG
jgi:hypothetical protein